MSSLNNIGTTNWKKLITEVVIKMALEFKDQENFEIVKSNLLDPIVDYIFDRLYPYIIATSIIFLLIFVLSCGIFYMILKSV